MNDVMMRNAVIFEGEVVSAGITDIPGIHPGLHLAVKNGDVCAKCTALLGEPKLPDGIKVGAAVTVIGRLSGCSGNCRSDGCRPEILIAADYIRVKR